MSSETTEILPLNLLNRTETQATEKHIHRILRIRKKTSVWGTTYLVFARSENVELLLDVVSKYQTLCSRDIRNGQLETEEREDQQKSA